MYILPWTICLYRCCFNNYFRLKSNLFPNTIGPFLGLTSRKVDIFLVLDDSWWNHSLDILTRLSAQVKKFVWPDLQTTNNVDTLCHETYAMLMPGDPACADGGPYLFPDCFAELMKQVWSKSGNFIASDSTFQNVNNVTVEPEAEHEIDVLFGRQ